MEVTEINKTKNKLANAADSDVRKIAKPRKWRVFFLESRISTRPSLVKFSVHPRRRNDKRDVASELSG